MDVLTFNAVKQHQHQVNHDLLDPWKKPAFAVVSMSSSAPWGTVTYNHYLQELSRQHYNDSGYMQGSTSSMGTEFFNTFYAYGQTNSYITSTDTTYGDGTSRCGHLGHIALGVGPDGTMIGRAGPYSATALRNVGVWVNNKTNKNLALFMENQYVGVAPRAIAPGRLMGTEGWHLAWSATKFYAQNDFGTYAKYGMIGYNEKTRTLVINENTNGGTAMRLHVYANVEPFDISASNRRSWFDNLDEADHTFFDWTANSAGYSESLYRGIVTPCDDGKIIIVRMEPHSYCMLDRFTPDGAGSFTKEATHTLSTTTTYGMEGGDRNGIRFQISNDGKYVICYQPYYYYGAGAEVFLIRVSDGKYVFLQYQDSSYGRSFAPIRDSDFMLSYSPNSDSGYGIYMSHIDTKNVFEVIADKGDISSKVPGFNVYIFDSAYHSTNYPYIVPIIGGN